MIKCNLQRVHCPICLLFGRKHIQQHRAGLRDSDGSSGHTTQTGRAAAALHHCDLCERRRTGLRWPTLGDFQFAPRFRQHGLPHQPQRTLANRIGRMLQCGKGVNGLAGLRRELNAALEPESESFADRLHFPESDAALGTYCVCYRGARWDGCRIGQVLDSESHLEYHLLFGPCQPVLLPPPQKASSKKQKLEVWRNGCQLNASIRRFIPTNRTECMVTHFPVFCFLN